jgi:type III secretory pathway component EscU
MTVTSCKNLFNYLISTRIVMEVSRTIVAIGLMAMTVMLTYYTVVQTVQALPCCSACKVADKLKQRELE